SRNDQVATDLRLYLRDHARGVAGRIVELADALMDQAGRHLDTPAPGFTHLQPAQPIAFGHQLLAHVQALLRDLDRLKDWDARASDRDLQEDKEPVFDAVDTLELVLPALAGMISTMTVRVDRLAAQAPVGYTLATEVAEWLVRQGVAFRDAHEITGKLVVLAA